MRIRKKKHLSERIEGMRDVIVVAESNTPDTRINTGEKLYFDFPTVFNNTNPVELEIGSGKGGFIVGKAKENPNVNFLAVEMLSNVIVMAGDLVKKENISNVLLFNCGADYLNRYIKKGSIRAVYLNFSPPFSGKRYENRRLTKPELIKDYYGMLEYGGKIELKTDDKDFFDYSISTLKQGGFTVENLTEQYKLGHVTSVKTEYEEKFLSLGYTIYFLRSTKV